MKCFNCGYQKINKEHEFCPVCSMELDNYCTRCNNFNPKQSHFCVSCGTKLDESNHAEEKHIKAGVIFADISGFTSLAEHYTPEQTREIINECFEEIAKPIYKYNGVIDKFIGDAVMAVFGTEKESFNTAINTIYCAMEMKDAIKKLNSDKFKDIIVKLDLSVGVSYGNVILGNVGTKMDFDYTVIGDVVNIASRFQNYANPGEIRVNDELYQLTNQYVMYSDVDQIKLKNKKNSVPSYIALDMKKVNKADLYIERNEEQLIKQYIGSDKKGILQIIGDSGIGKSYMLSKLTQQYEDSQNIVRIELNNSDSMISYSAISNIIKSIIKVKMNDSKERIHVKLESFMSSHMSADIDQKRILDFFSLLLKLPRTQDFDSIVQSMNYQDLKNEIKYQWEQFVNHLEDYVFIIDNGHFIDDNSKYLLGDIQHKTMINTQKALQLDQEDFSIHMSGFDEKMIKDYFTQYFMTSISDELIQYVYKWSAGIPLYVKELCFELEHIKKDYRNNKMILSEEALKQIPETLEKMNLQKIDQLSKEHKHILQVASCFTNDFNLNDISQMMKVKYNDEIEDVLLDKGFIQMYSYQRVSNRTYNTYVFTNDEIKSTVYQTLLEKTKLDHHLQIANIYYKDSDDFETRAYHYEYSRNKKVASDLYEQAAQKYHASFDLEKALEYYIKSIEFDDSSTSQNRSEILIQIVQLHIYKSDFENAHLWVEKALDKVAEKEFIHQLRLLEIEILRELGQMDKAFDICELLEKTIQKSSRNYGKLLQLKSTIMDMTGKTGVIELCDQSKDILLKSKDFESLTEALIQGGIRHFIEGRPRDAIDYLEEALKYANQTSNKALMAKVLNNLGIMYNQFGEREKSHVYFKNAIDLSILLANRKNLVSLRINLGVSFLHIGSYNASLDELTEALRMATKEDMLFHQLLSLMNLGDVYYDIGEFDIALGQYNQAVEISEKLQAPIETAICKIGVSKVQIEKGNFESVERFLNQSLETLLEIQEYSYVSLINHTMAEYYLQNGDINAAMDQINDAIKYAELAQDNQALVCAYQKKLEILYRDGKDDYDLFKNTISLANMHNLYNQLASLYLSRFVELEDHDKGYLMKAKEMTMFFDRSSITQKIESHILRSNTDL